MLNSKIKLLMALLVMSPVASYAMTTLLINSSGQLVGATGVVVDGAIYDVSFSNDGSCSDLYLGCDDQSDFAFNTAADASLASQALLDQVLTGIYDTDPSLTVGCFQLTQCNVWTVYNTDPINDVVSVMAAVNGNGTTTFDGLAPFTLTRGSPTSPTSVWAIWTPTGAQVPLPGALVMMFSALLGLGIFKRKR